MTYASPTRARELHAAWLSRHPELAQKHPLLARAARWEAWRRALTASRRGNGAIVITRADYEVVAARLVSQLRRQRHGACHDAGVWWAQVQEIAAEIGWEAKRHLFFVAKRNQQTEAA